MTKNYVWIGAVVVLAIGSILFFVPARQTSETGAGDNQVAGTGNNKNTPVTAAGEKPATPPPSSAGSAPVPSGTKARVLFTLTDAAVDLGNIEAIFLTINEISVHKAGAGWVSITKTQKQIDILKLYRLSKSIILADLNLNIGVYDQIRLAIGKIVVVPREGSIEEAKIPSSELKISGKLEVNPKQISAVEFDIQADKSLHKTGSGKYIFLPVLRVRSLATVSKTQILRNDVIGENTIEIFDGLEKYVANLGMDETGALRMDFSFGQLAKFEIEGEKIKLLSR